MAERKGRVMAVFGEPLAATAIELLELTEMAWHDCDGEITPSEDVIDDILLCSEGEMPKLIHAVVGSHRSKGFEDVGAGHALARRQRVNVLQMPKRLALYLRVSTDSQTTTEPALELEQVPGSAVAAACEDKGIFLLTAPPGPRSEREGARSSHQACH